MIDDGSSPNRGDGSTIGGRRRFLDAPGLPSAGDGLLATAGYVIRDVQVPQAQEDSHPMGPDTTFIEHGHPAMFGPARLRTC